MLTISARVRGKRAARSPTGVVCGAGGDAGGRAGGGLGGGGDGGLVVTGTSFVPCEKTRSASDTCSQARVKGVRLVWWTARGMWGTRDKGIGWLTVIFFVRAS